MCTAKSLNRRCFLPAIFLLAHLLPGELSRGEPTDIDRRPIGQIERLDAALDEIVAPDAVIEALVDGLDWSEGPVWIRDGGYLLFSDVPQNTVYKWREDQGVTTYLQPSGSTGAAAETNPSGSNGLAVDPQGRLVLCQHGDRRVARMDAPLDDPQPRFVTIVAHYSGKRLNSPNDLVYHSSGALYFTDPPYGLRDEAQRQLDFNGVYRVDGDGNVTLLEKDLARPNGIALSPDEKTLYVAQSHDDAKIYQAYDVLPDGGVANGRILFDATALGRERPGSPDGMAIDRRGNLLATGPGGVLVITPDGKHVGTIAVGERIANCAFGDDGKTLYMTCDRYLCRVRLKTTGLGF